MTRTEMTRTMIRTKAAPFNDGSIEPNLGSRYGEIGISAVTAALQYKIRAGCKHVTGRLHSTAHLLRTTCRTARKVARAGGHTLNPPDQVFLKRYAACERVAELTVATQRAGLLGAEKHGRHATLDLCPEDRRLRRCRGRSRAFVSGRSVGVCLDVAEAGGAIRANGSLAALANSRVQDPETASRAVKEDLVTRPSVRLARSRRRLSRVRPCSPMDRRGARTGA